MSVYVAEVKKRLEISTNLVLVVIKAKVLAHAGRFGVANVGAVEEGGHVAQEGKQDKSAIKLADEPLLRGRIDLRVGPHRAAVWGDGQLAVLCGLMSG